MKKFAIKTTFIMLSALFMFNQQVTAQEFKAGKEYEQVRPEPTAQKEVIELFSFYCPHCYEFNTTYKIPQKIQQGLPKDAVLKEYHVDFLGGQSEELTRAWALAMVLGKEENVRMPLFQNAQNNAIKSMDDIRTIFLENGITAEQFDGGINSFVVNGLVNKQKQVAEEFKVRGVPAFFINGQYKINPEGFSDVSSTDEFIKRYVDTILFLIKNK
ncbi:thiol:disulfide interchange protein [Vespertiliibacter pulmonis]|uniref:Thiol:disulfide interchange protein n=1 Tax=Vespertiliibacter pulmonis TaxID=1443036 RepID=A0A3N4W3X1_9PAST|nr:DsbA family protein [Vespertiliibacter pulmonis]QLB20988.1 thiol:disulfide interchange protein [Vespertiliibacter pulmonis]RPE80760.1 thiol:disulfide interchange protein DsbA [Vespertiliibacter pulmonis]